MAIDYDALESLVIVEQVAAMKLLVKSLVQYTGKFTAQEKRNLLAKNLLHGGLGGSMTSSLGLTTFVLKVLEHRGKLDVNLLSVITKLQNDMNFSNLLDYMV